MIRFLPFLAWLPLLRNRATLQTDVLAGLTGAIVVLPQTVTSTFDEAEALAALHLAAFGTPYMTTENRLTWMRAPGYKPELDLVVETSEGQLAAFCLGGISEQDNARTGRKDGYTDPVGVHPNFQRRGLARALLLSAFQRLKERGMETAKLSTGSWNIAMQTAAQAVGYQITATTLYFEKALDLKKATAQ